MYVICTALRYVHTYMHLCLYIYINVYINVYYMHSVEICAYIHTFMYI